MRHKLAIITVIHSIWFSGLVLAADTDEENAIRADCQIEGEAGGLYGAALEEFVAECVKDLMGTQLINVVD